MSNERSDVGRCGEMHDAEQNEEHPTSSKQPNTSRCRHDKTYHITSNENKISDGYRERAPTAVEVFLIIGKRGRAAGSRSLHRLVRRQT